jgi:hypothetical protein
MSFQIRLAAIAIAALATVRPIDALGGGSRHSKASQQHSEARDRDKTGTTTSPENNTGSQGAAMQQLASRVSFEAEGKGLALDVFHNFDSHTSLERNSLHFNRLRNAGGCWMSPGIAVY